MEMYAHSGGPIRCALVGDYDVILAGDAHLFDRYQERVVVVELDANRPVAEDVDVALFDAFAQPEADTDLATLISNRHARRVAVYTWNFRPVLIEAAVAMGASGCRRGRWSPPLRPSAGRDGCLAGTDR